MIAVSVCVVMGMTWVFGFLMILEDNATYQVVLSWFFTLFNSLQVKLHSELFVGCMEV